MNSLLVIAVTQIFIPYAAGKPPNIVFIVADDLGYNDVGYHGSEIHTPNIDRLANTGIKLDNYYVQPICTPSRSQLLSGRYQIHTGLQHYVLKPGQRNGLPTDIPTLADVLKEQGYSTHMVGKWHLGYYKKEYTPLYRGFDSYFGYLLGSEDYFKHTKCYTYSPSTNETGCPECCAHNYKPKEIDGTDDISGESCGLDFHDGEKNALNYTGEYSTEIFSRKAEEIIKVHARKSGPLFMYLPFQSVHAPLQAPEQYVKQYSHIDSKNRRIFSGMVSALDEAVGNITATLESSGLLNDTIIFFTTDNGGQVIFGGNNAPLRGWKQSLWEGGMRGVGFINSPLLPNPGSTHTGLIHISDWFPTILTLAGGDISKHKLDGFDQWDALTKQKSSPRKELLHNIDPLYPKVGKNLYPDSWDTRVRAALRVGNWKIITGNPCNGSWVPPQQNGVPYPHYVRKEESKNKNLWLFDIANDPRETTDVSALYPSLVKELLDKIVMYNQTAVPCRFPPVDPGSNPKLHGGFWGPWVE